MGLIIKATLEKIEAYKKIQATAQGKEADQATARIADLQKFLLQCMG